ncbi:FtsH protease activity modulator HflK [Labrys monachus]|uniref:Protein HflK n=1 Tax=Labrys monachus TaxID=217067 RepID=A0ABU0FKU8_9HYPH|nr:FtsH protease activity modulator HflK [Labrys monachus]MDQ0395230.1 membrane protease subunit HflK [Labrys monachus]
MPWSNQSGGGGPWGSGGGGGNGNGNGRGPWGGGPSGGSQPPDLEDWLRRSKDGLRNFQGGGGFTPRNILVGIVVLVGIWLLTGFYRVQPNEVGLNLVFGKFTSVSPPGLRYNIPYPIGTVEKPTVTTVETINVGTRSDTDSNEEMLTGDENIVDIGFTVQWQINPAAPQDYQFNLSDPKGTIRAVAESAMREAIGERTISPILTGDRQAIEQQVQEEMQKALDSYKAGVIVRLVQLQNVDPPPQVIDAFRDVQAARADQENTINQAQVYANKVIPEAIGRAAGITQAAEAYRAQTVAEATGEATRFNEVYAAYQKSPAVTRERMYLEAMTTVLSGATKVIADNKNQGQGVVPYLPLGQMLKPAPAPQPQQGATP